MLRISYFRTNNFVFVSATQYLPTTLLEETGEFSEQPIDTSEPVSMAKILAKREEVLQKYKFRIGLLSSTLLENPEQKVIIALL